MSPWQLCDLPGCLRHPPPGTKSSAEEASQEIGDLGRKPEGFQLGGLSDDLIMLWFNIDGHSHLVKT